MTEKIVRVVHRHSEKKATDKDLVLEVGKELPRFYQIGRARGVTVQRINGTDPVVCTLSDGGEILIGKRSVVDVSREP